MNVSSVWNRSICGASVVAAITLLLASTAVAQTAKEVMDRNIKAQGGREALLGLKALERKGEVSVDGTFGQLEGTVEETVVPWKMARRTIDLNVFVQTEGYNGTKAWRENMMGINELEDEEASQIKQSCDLNPFLMIEKREIKAEKLDDDKIDDVECYVLQLTPKDRPPVKYFIDKKTDLVKRTSLTQNNPQFGKVEVAVDTSDYQEFGPVKLANKSKAKLGEVMEIETKYTETKVNGKIDEATFDVPKGDAK